MSSWCHSLCSQGAHQRFCRLQIQGTAWQAAATTCVPTCALPGARCLTLPSKESRRCVPTCALPGARGKVLDTVQQEKQEMRANMCIARGKVLDTVQQGKQEMPAQGSHLHPLFLRQIAVLGSFSLPPKYQQMKSLAKRLSQSV
eukprot:1160862-Pelagomonas_calceolata.AAC.10